MSKQQKSQKKPISRIAVINTSGSNLQEQLTNAKNIIRDLLTRDFIFFRLAHCPEETSWQCTEVALNARRRHRNVIMLHSDVDELSPKDPFTASFGNDDAGRAAFQKEMEKIHESGPTVASALGVGTYTQMLRDQLESYLLCLHETMVQHKEKCAICFSSFPLSGLASPESKVKDIPYDAEKSFCVIYTMSNEKIIDAEHFPAPRF